MTWYLGEALRLLDADDVSDETHQPEILRQWLVERFSDAVIDVRNIVRCGPGRLRDTALVRRLIPILERKGWLMRVGANEAAPGEAARGVVRGPTLTRLGDASRPSASRPSSRGRRRRRNWRESQMSHVAGVLRRGEEAMNEEERDAWEERAAIIEFDAGVPRPEAEALAMQEILAARPPSWRSAQA